MGNTEDIELDGQVFKVFRKLPIPLARTVQRLFIDMAEDYTGTLDELESGKVSPKDAKNIKIDVLYEIYDLLLTRAVISPKITVKDIQDINHDYQLYFNDLAELLLEKFSDSKKSVKKKSLN